MAFAESSATGNGWDDDRPSSPTRVQKLVRIMLALIIGIALVGVPVMQAATALPCGQTLSDMADHSQAPGPCKDAFPGCAQMPSCGVSALLEARVIVATDTQAWTRAVYWSVAGLLDGLRLAPAVGPPIAI
jgi:hypothetical protein